MKILKASEMRAIDQATFQRTGVSSLAVMESAGRAVAQYLLQNYELSLGDKITVLCGLGNNGGDGFVIGRTFSNLGFDVAVLSSKEISNLRGDALVNAKSFLELITDSGPYFEQIDESFLKTKSFQNLYRDSSLIIDCLYGTGFRGALEGIEKKLVEKLNEQASCPVVAVDVPSGVEVDSALVNGEVLKADLTIALQYLKACHVFYPATEYCGEVVVADIGLTSSLDELADIKCELMTPVIASNLLSNLDQNVGLLHKGKKGSLLVVGGSKGMYGAPQMTAESALISGAGLVTLALPNTVFKEIAPRQKELMCVGLVDTGEGNFAGGEDKNLIQALQGKSALAVGPGISTEYGSKLLLEEILEHAKENHLPLVLDADALNILAEERALFELLGEHVVLTPHPGEIARLLDCSSAEIQRDRLSAAQKLSEETSSVVVLKGARTIIAAPDGRVRVNPAAVETLATAGSGDVLTGVIAAFLARGFNSFDAASLGVFLHGEVGEYLRESLKGPVGAKATDIVRELPSIINFFIENDFNIPSFYHSILNQRPSDSDA